MKLDVKTDLWTEHMYVDCRLTVMFSMMGFVSYYGHVQNTSHLGSSITTSHVLGACVEVSLETGHSMPRCEMYMFITPVLTES